MTCPECRVYPINPRSKHRLCVKCCYGLVRKKLREKRAKEKAKPKKLKCPFCDRMFTPYYKGNKFCGTECQTNYPTKRKNEKWAAKGKRKVVRKKQGLHHLGIRGTPFNKFDRETYDKIRHYNNKFDSN